MIDIYEASGGVVNEARTQVSMASGMPTKSFDIKLRVILTGVEYDIVDGEKATFSVILEDERRLEEDGIGGAILRFIEHEATLTLPVQQVHILKEETNA